MITAKEARAASELNARLAKEEALVEGLINKAIESGEYCTAYSMHVDPYRISNVLVLKLYDLGYCIMQTYDQHSMDTLHKLRW